MTSKQSKQLVEMLEDIKEACDKGILLLENYSDDGLLYFNEIFDERYEFEKIKKEIENERKNN